MLDTIKNEIKIAMKNKDNPRKNILKLVLGKAQAIAKEEHRDITDEDVMAAITKEIKQINQALDMIKFDDLSTKDEFFNKNTYELSILMQYVPAQLTDEELTTQIQEVLSTIDTSNRGLVMKTVMTKFKGVADGKRINQVVTTVLANK